MYVSECMHTDLTTVGENENIDKAFSLLKEKRIRHLPVVDDEGRLAGIVTDRDLRLVFCPDTSGAYHLPKSMKVGEVMTQELFVIGPHTEVEDAAKAMIENRIGALPVVDPQNDRLVGIVTETDVLKLFVEMFGMLRKSSRLDVALGDDPKSVEKVLQTVHGAGGEVISVSWNNHYQYAGKGVYTVRIEGENDKSVRGALSNAGYDILN